MRKGTAVAHPKPDGNFAWKAKLFNLVMVSIKKDKKNTYFL